MRTLAKALFLAAALSSGVAGLGACGTTDTERRRDAAQFTDDAAVTARVKNAIASDAGARTAASVNVDTHRGVVQLTGFVDSEEQASRAVAAAKKVEGVRSVRNDLRLKKP